MTYSTPHPRDFFLAIRHQKADDVARLLGLGADPNWETRGGDETALAFAARVCTVEIVRLLLERGATNHGQMPLVDAVTWDRTDPNEDRTATARLLLDYGGDVNRADEDGWTPLMEAAAAGDLPTLQLYLQYGADIHAVSRRGYTALSLAVANGRDEIVELLREVMTRA